MDGTQKKRENTQADIHPGNLLVRARFGALVLGFYVGEMNPVGWLEDNWD